MSGNRARILSTARDVVAKWDREPKLQDALRELRPEFARVLDALSEVVFASGNRARLREDGFQDARLAGALTHELDSAELIR